MRVLAYALMGALTFATANAAVADGMANMKGMAMPGPPAAKHGAGVGVIRAIDTKRGALTIQHGPIPSPSGHPTGRKEQSETGLAG